MANIINIEIDGTVVQMPQGSTVMDAANRIGVYIPHFCYHKKLSIAANCRMCLVQVEKAPKPLPACATPVAEGMKVHTHSEQAVTAQKGVMEFLLINHPLDCPICDQGGECQLQDLAVGYGASNSRYTEDKRVVFHKNAGPLISMEEMTRCIHCTRCVRFGVEVAGVMELGMSGRGEHSEIHTFVGRTIDSEISGNMIDLCPVGALTSKPFRYTARTWELARRRRSIAPHDSLGSNLVVQVKQERVMRVLPLENEEINQCWLSDKDRFSYEGLNSPDRLTVPMIRREDGWKEVDWQTALRFVADGLRGIAADAPAQIAAWVSPNSTIEEMELAAQLMRGLGSDNIEHRLRQTDFRADAKRRGAPWLGMRIAEIDTLDRILVVGSFLRKDHPLLSARIRGAVRKGAGLGIVHSVDDNLLMPVVAKAIVAPDQIADVLSKISIALSRSRGESASQELSGIEPDEAAQQIAGSLAQGKSVGIFLGNFAVRLPDYSRLHALVQEIARQCNGRFGVLGEAANSVGGYLARAMPSAPDAAGAFAEPCRAVLLFNVEPELDCGDPAAAMKIVRGAELVIAMSPYKHSLETAHVLLPIAPFTETSGTFVNCEGRAQGFNGVVRPLGETRPGWKVLRVLGNLLELPGFEYESSEAVRDQVLGAGVSDLTSRLSNEVAWSLSAPASSQNDAQASGLQRIADVPIYHTDSIVRRAPSLQHTADAQLAPRVIVSGATAERLGLVKGMRARVIQGSGEAILQVVIDDRVADECARVPAALASTAGLGPMSGRVTLERAE